MSLVIALWDQSFGMAVSEGRAVAKVNGTKVPVREDQSKLSRLANGAILGLTGGLRDSYETTTMRESLVTDPLRQDIHAEAEKHSFREMHFVIPRLLAEYAAKFPELGFGVSLLGNDGGTVRGAAWSSNGSIYEPADAPGVRAIVLGCNEAVNREATEAVRKATANQHFLNAATVLELRQIITGLSRNHVELNDHICFEFVTVRDPRVVPLPSADHNTAVGADGFCLNTLEPAQAGADVTADHILTSSVQASGVTALANPNAMYAVSGLGWTVSASGASDVYNVQGWLYGEFGCNGTEPVTAEVDAWVCVDGNTSVMHGLGAILLGLPATSSVINAGGAFFATVTGLSAGAHTLQVYISTPGCSGVGSGGQSGVSVVKGQAILQRIY